MSPQRQKLEIAEATLSTIEERLGLPWRSLRTPQAVAAHFDATEAAKPDELELAEAWRVVGAIARHFSYVDEQLGTPLGRLTTWARTLLRVHEQLVAQIRLLSDDDRSPVEAILEEQLVGRDLLPYLERLRARSPGLSDRAVANELSNFERRGGQLLK